jgi:hypothetical protein
MIVANHRKARNLNYICILNLFTGITGVGWVAALIWALLDKPMEPKYIPQVRPEVIPETTKPVLQVQQPIPVPDVPIEKAPVRIKYVHHGR